MSQSQFTVMDEGGFQAAQIFVQEWLSFVVPRLEEQLGVRLDDPEFRVFLSPTELHQERFPIPESESRVLEGPFDGDGDSRVPVDDAGNAVRVRGSGVYAHGVATRARSSLKLGSEVPEGAPVICLDVPTLTRLADEHEVTVEAMLARVVVHELAHVLRGHIDDDESTHGYVREGDAQRDTWQLLTDALASDFSRLSAEARAGMIRLAAAQPGAYRRFGLSSPSTGRWDPEVRDPEVWVLTPTRETRVLAQQAVIETPLLEARVLGTPQIGDRVVLVSEDLAAGEWVIIGIADASEAQHPVDERALKRLTTAGERTRWLHLRRQSEMVATENLRLYNRDLAGKPIREEDRQQAWADVDKRPLAEVLTAIGERRRARFRTDIERTRRELEEMGAEVPDIDVDAWDPFQD